MKIAICVFHSPHATNDTLWSKAGEEIGWEQFKMPFSTANCKSQKIDSENVLELDNLPTVNTSIWRAPIDNDGIKNWAGEHPRHVLTMWRKKGIR